MLKWLEPNAHTGWEMCVKKTCTLSCLLLLLLLMMIAPNSRARKVKGRGRWRGSIDEFKGRGRGVLTTEEWCNQHSKEVEWGLSTRGLKSGAWLIRHNLYFLCVVICPLFMFYYMSFSMSHMYNNVNDLSRQDEFLKSRPNVYSADSLVGSVSDSALHHFPVVWVKRNLDRYLSS